MWIVEGDVTMTVGGETKTLGAGDVVVVNRGVEHELHSEGGMTFVEALAPVLRITCRIPSVIWFSPSRVTRFTPKPEGPRLPTVAACSNPVWALQARGRVDRGICLNHAGHARRDDAHARAVRTFAERAAPGGSAKHEGTSPAQRRTCPPPRRSSMSNRPPSTVQMLSAAANICSVTSQGSVQARFQRACDRGQVLQAEMAVREMPHVHLGVCARARRCLRAGEQPEVRARREALAREISNGGLTRPAGHRPGHGEPCGAGSRELRLRVALV